MKEFTPEQKPLLPVPWTLTQTNLGFARATLGEREKGARGSRRR
jgi:hypothetical protein